MPLTSEATGSGSSGWRTGRWGELATLEYGRVLQGYRDCSGPYRVFGTNGPIGWHTEAHCEHASVIVGRKGAYRGIHFSPGPFSVIDTAFFLKPTVEMDTRWAYYALLTQDINRMDSGSAIPSTSREDFYQLPVSVPPIADQQHIAHILGRLDDKIELNRRMNETLEALARTLFKSWFVDYEPVRAKIEGRDTGLPQSIAAIFPTEIARMDGQDAPVGWSAYSLNDIAVHHTSTVSPSATPDVLFEHYSIPAHGAGQTPTLEPGVAIKSNKTLVPRDAVLLSKLNPYIPRVWAPSHPQGALQICSTEFLAFAPSAPGSRSLLFSLFSDGKFRSMLQSLVTGTSKSHQRVPPKSLKARFAITGEPNAFRAFDRLARPWLNRVIANRVESQSLAKIRDLLLPKLISGEIRASQVERAVEAGTGAAHA